MFFFDAWKVFWGYLARLFDCVWVCLTYFEVYILALDTWSMHIRYALSVVDHLLHWFGFRYCLIFLGENKVSYIFQSFWVKPLRIPQMEKCLISFWVRMMFWKLGTWLSRPWSLVSEAPFWHITAWRMVKTERGKRFHQRQPWSSWFIFFQRSLGMMSWQAINFALGFARLCHLFWLVWGGHGVIEDDK